MRLVLVDDHDELRQTLRRMLERSTEIEVVGEAADGAEALQIVDASHPDVVLVDVNLPHVEGTACTRRIKTRFPDVRVVAWSGELYGESEMRQAGADAFVLKGGPSDDLIEALRNQKPVT